MASITAIKGPGVLYPFLAGLLLSLTLVSGQTTTSSPANSANSATPNGTTYWTSNSWTSMSMISCPSFICNYSDCNAMYTSQNASMCSGAYCELIRLTDICYQANCTDVCSSNKCMNANQTGCSVDCCNSTDCLNATFASMMPSAPMPTTIGPAITAWNSSSMSNSSSMNISYSISCPSFICNYSDCNTMYTSQNASMCAGAYCQLIRLTDIGYSASCTDFCGNACINASQTGCFVDCCNSTDCLNATFASMISSTTIATTIGRQTVTTPSSTTRTPPVTTRPPPTTTTPATTKPKPQIYTVEEMGNKCHTATCDDTECYTSFSDAHVQPCAQSEMHCELKRNKMGERVMWTAGCTTSCSSGTWCQSDSKPPSCHQECCNATTTSCLKLDGKLYVPNLATGGPHFHIELIGFLICLLCFGSLM